MTAILVAPDLDKAVMQKTGIFTLSKADASVAGKVIGCNCPDRIGNNKDTSQGCSGFRVEQIPLQYRKFDLLARQMGQRFIERQKVRGFEWMNTPLRLHGPFESYDFENTMVDVDSPVWSSAAQRDKADNFEHRERVVPLVFERPVGAANPKVDYQFVGEFLFQDFLTDLELPNG